MPALYSSKLLSAIAVAVDHDRNQKGTDNYLSLGFQPIQCYNFIVEKTATKFHSFTEAEKADREFYRKLSGQERLNILLELSKHEPERRLERVYRITKLPRR